MKKSPKKSKRDKNVTVARKQQTTLRDLRFQEIKKYVNFKNTAKNARKIKKYHELLEPLIKQPHSDYKTASKKNRAIVLKSVGSELTTRHKGLKVIPVPSSGAEDIIVKISRGQMVQESRFTRIEHIDFDKKKLAKGGKTYVDSLVAKYKQNDLFQIKTGEFHIASSFARDFIGTEVAKLQEKYSVGQTVQMSHRSEKRKITRANSWRKWLHGVIRYTGKNQVSVRDYIARQERTKKAGYKARKKAIRRGTIAKVKIKRK